MSVSGTPRASNAESGTNDTGVIVAHEDMTDPRDVQLYKDIWRLFVHLGLTSNNWVLARREFAVRLEQLIGFICMDLI
jgi:hypothetical protein